MAMMEYLFKSCTIEVSTPFEIIFNDCINFGMFPGCWRFANVPPIHKKENPPDLKEL